MLPNYSPLKVAEVFMELEALAPGRIDLGLGRALGADGITGRALGSQMSDVFPQYFALLSAWLLDAAGVEPFPSPHPFANVKASPSGPSHPDLFLLCSSADSARFAGMAGVGMVFAEFIARTRRRAGGGGLPRGVPALGLSRRAVRRRRHHRAGRRHRRGGRPPRRPRSRARRSAPASRRRARASSAGSAATARRCGPILAEKAAHTGADELFVLNGGPTLASRLRSMELIAEKTLA